MSSLIRNLPLSERAALLLALLLALAGCQRAPEAERQMQNYLERVARVLKQDWQTFEPDQLARYRFAARRERLIAIAPLRISLLDLIVDTGDCRVLQQRISERNTVLGKVAPWSHRLAYDGQLLRALDQCTALLKAQPEQQPLREQLKSIANSKRATLTATFWNALNASEEFEQYLRFASRPLPVSPAPLTDRAAIEALNQLAEIGASLPRHLPPERAQLDTLLQALQSSQRGGELITSLAQSIHGLQQATAMLQATDARLLCPMQAPSARSKILLNVFVRFYAGEIQPYLAQLQRLGQPWADAILTLRAVPGIPAATAAGLDRLVGDETALWQRYQSAVAAHTQAWQDLLGACQSQPGQSGWQLRAAN
ncbi:MAG: DUF3080 family protein [Halopseudomonas sp.]|uniref:DUF3080 family protein n=1 Tax=Halopseudomonas sp. TaxID=2901191 RepID=UPI0030016C20